MHLDRELRTVSPPQSCSWKGALRFLCSSTGFVLVVACFLWALQGPDNIYALARSSGGRCGTCEAMIGIAILHGGILQVIGALSGVALCRKCNCLARMGRFLALATVTIATTCVIFTFIVLPAASGL